MLKKKLKINKIGEFELVERIKKIIYPAKRGNGRLIIGPGDDAFVSKISPDFLLVVTKDLLIEDVHFKLGWTTAQDLGYKAIAVNLSDLAAMGAVRPLYALVGIALPGDISVDFVEKLYIGMCKISDKYGLKIAGGDTTSSKKHIVISITLLGEAKKKHILLRSGAMPGDLIMVTGTFGDSAGGLFLLKRGIKKPKNYQKYLINKHRLPEPRISQAHKIAGSGLATSMIDSSDGLAACVNFLSKESKSGMRLDLEKVPVSKQLNELKKDFNEVDLLDYALKGGEDYELVFTVNPKNLKKVNKILPGAREVGEVTKDKGIKYCLYNKEIKLEISGYQHFN
ncbi:MAG: thiamine-phosphate kinase [Elusimicrobia bacterium]|nr:thiamine-phosphate kinase [Candidatus Liberimonas magnetica]